MQRPLLFFALLGLAIILGVSAAGYYLGKLAEERAEQGSPSPTPEVTATTEPSPSPSPLSSPSPSASPRFVSSPKPKLPTAPPASVRPSPLAHVKGESFPSGDLPTIPAGRRTGGSDASGDLRVVFVDAPSNVRSGESFTVSWRVEGREGVSGDNTTLSWSYVQGGASSSGKQSFGSFTVPKTFRTTLTFAGSAGTIHFTVDARVGEKIVQATAAAQLAE